MCRGVRRECARIGRSVGGCVAGTGVAAVVGTGVARATVVGAGAAESVLGVDADRAVLGLRAGGGLRVLAVGLAVGAGLGVDAVALGRAQVDAPERGVLAV